jgi:hypothetical protein
MNRTHAMARGLTVIAALIAGTLTAGAAHASPQAAGGTRHAPAGTGRALTQVATYDVRADIDGHSLLTLTSDTARWYQIAFAAPGVHNGQNNPTIINGIQWFPIWPHPGENRDCHCHSSTFTGLTPPVPMDALATYVVKVSCRDSCSATYSDGTLVLDFNDDPSGSDAWYEIKVTLFDASRAALSPRHAATR